MRTLSAALKAEQEKVSATPYIKLKFTYTATAWAASTAYTLGELVRPTTANGYRYKCTTAGTSAATEPAWPTIIGNTVADGTVVWTCNALTEYDYSARLIYLEHHEEPYNDYAIIRLKNENLSMANIVGYWVQIGYGFYTGINVAEPNGDNAGNEYSYTPRVWVKAQQTVSMEGILTCVLNLEGMWAMLRELPYQVGNPPFHTVRYTIDTIYAIIDTVLTAGGFNVDALGVEDDGIINTFTPQFSVNLQPYEAMASLIYRLVSMTKCYLRAEAGKEVKVVYPEAADAVDRNYYSDAAHYFNEYLEADNALVPNHVIVYANEGDDGLWTNMLAGEAKTQAEIDAYGDIRLITSAAAIGNQTDANNLAAAILVRLKAEQRAGRGVVPHDCGLELYDKVAFNDKRDGGASYDVYPGDAITRVGSLVHHYSAGVYALEVVLGDVTSDFRFIQYAAGPAPAIIPPPRPPVIPPVPIVPEPGYPYPTPPPVIQWPGDWEELKKQEALARLAALPSFVEPLKPSAPELWVQYPTVSERVTPLQSWAFVYPGILDTIIQSGILAQQQHEDILRQRFVTGIVGPGVIITAPAPLPTYAQAAAQAAAIGGVVGWSPAGYVAMTTEAAITYGGPT